MERIHLLQHSPTAGCLEGSHPPGASAQSKAPTEPNPSDPERDHSDLSPSPAASPLLIPLEMLQLSAVAVYS